MHCLTGRDWQSNCMVYGIVYSCPNTCGAKNIKWRRCLVISQLSTNYVLKASSLANSSGTLLISELHRVRHSIIRNTRRIKSFYENLIRVIALFQLTHEWAATKRESSRATDSRKWWLTSSERDTTRWVPSTTAKRKYLMISKITYRRIIFEISFPMKNASVFV